MPLNRTQRHRQAIVASYKSGKAKPPTRKQAQAWLAPIRNALAVLRSGSVDAIRGYPVTRLHERDDYVRIDYAIAGFRGLIERLQIPVDLDPLFAIEKRLAAGVLLEVRAIDEALAMLHTVEDSLIKFSRAEVKSAVLDEQIVIELEALGLKEAA